MNLDFMCRSCKFTFIKHKFADALIMNVKKIMGTSILATVLILAGTVLLVLGTLPMQNKLDENNLVVKFVIGKKVIDISDAVVMPIPDEVNHNIIRVCGTSLGKKHSGKFMNTKTKTKYSFYLTGKGERTYFVINDDQYLVDGIILKNK